jgi:hypothetical protein
MENAPVMNRSVVQKLRCVGPYVLIELLLPGGTLIALLLWLTHHGGSFRNVAVFTPSTVPSVTAPAASRARTSQCGHCNKLIAREPLLL